MRWRDRVCVILSVGWVFVAAAGAIAAAPATRPFGAAGPFEVATALVDFRDAGRDRVVPVKLYYPAGVAATRPSPVILFSHGLGGTREAGEFLGKHWASHGYVTVHMQHAGSDADVWRGATRPMEQMRKAADARNAIARTGDVRFVLDELARLDAGAVDFPLKGRMDLTRVGMSGHSFGAVTTLAIAGRAPAILRVGGVSPVADPRVKAAVALSPSPGAGDPATSFAAVRIPIFHMTGTRDVSPINDTKAADRRVPFDHIKLADQYLLTLDGGDHAVFSGRRARGQAVATDAAHHELIRAGSLVFWDAYLKDDAGAKEWLAGAGGFTAAVGKAGTYERKRAAAN